MHHNPIYHVMPERGGWILKAEGATHAMSHHRNQEEAIVAGRRQAERHKTQLVVHDASGKVEKTEYPKDPPRWG